MKKTIAILLSLCLCIGLCACNDSPAASDTQEATDEVITEQTEEITEKTEEITEPEIWTIVKQVDEFGDETGETYLEGNFWGTFSNTATTDSKLLVKVIFNKTKDINERGDVIGFQLLEYGDHPAVYTTSDTITLKVKIDGNIYETALFGNPPNGEVFFAGHDSSNLITNFYKKFNPAIYGYYEQDEIPCIIEIGSTKYSFRISIVEDRYS